MRNLVKWMIPAALLLAGVCTPAPAQSISNTVSFATVNGGANSLYSIGSMAPQVPNVLIQQVSYNGGTFSEYAQWQASGCGAIDGVFWLRPPASPALAGCYRASGFMPPVPSITTAGNVTPQQFGANCHQADANFTGSISGTTLTVDPGSVTGTIRIGQLVWGPNAGPSLYTVITAGSGLSWTVNNSQTVPDNTLESVAAITSGDIAANPQWIGTYVVGDTWDTVGVNEAILNAFAGTSTPGHIIWNETLSNGSYSNKTYS